MKALITFFIPFFFIFVSYALGGDETWNTPTSYDPMNPDGFRWEETEGILTVESNGDVFQYGKLELRSTTKIIFKPGFRAYTNSTMWAGIDSDLDGFTESDIDDDGIPDHYEDKVSSLDRFDPEDAVGFNSFFNASFYDVYHLNLDHQFISTGSVDSRVPFVNDLTSDFNFDDNGIIDTTTYEYFGNYDGDGIKDYYMEVTQYDPNWSLPFYYSAYTGFSTYSPFSFRVWDEWSNPISALINGYPWGYSSVGWSSYVTYDIKYDIVRYGVASSLWEGGSFAPSYGAIPETSGELIHPVSVEVLSKTGNNWTIEMTFSSSVSGKHYTPIALRNGVWVKIGPVRVGTGGTISSQITLDNSEYNISFQTAAFRETEEPEAILEVISDEIVSSGSKVVYNPSGIILNEEAKFKIDVTPNETVTWSKKSGSGSISFVGGNTGEIVTVKGVTQGDIVLEASVASLSVNPTIQAQVVDKKTVSVAIGLLNPGSLDSAVKDSGNLHDLIADLREVFQQIGVTFQNPLIYSSFAYDADYENVDISDTSLMNQIGGLIDASSDSFDGIEIYIAPSIQGTTAGLAFYQDSDSSKPYIGILLDGDTMAQAFDTFGNLIEPNNLVVLMGHEIGHTMGCEHITGAALLPYQNTPRKSAMTRDHSGDNSTGYRYYAPGARMTAGLLWEGPTPLLHRLIMYTPLQEAQLGYDLNYGYLSGNDNIGSTVYEPVDCGFFSPAKNRQPNFK